MKNGMTNNELLEALSDAEARIRDLEAKAGAPKGWKLVPIIPTQTMCVLGNEKAEEWRKFPLRISSIWKTMLEAAPIPPTVEKMAEKPSSYCTVNKADKSTCQLHNLQCAYPSCIDAALSEHKEQP